MNREFRRILLEKLAGGPLTSFVEKNLTPKSSTGNFKELFLKTPPGPGREKLVFDEIVRRGKPQNLVPVTIDGPRKTKITYHVMPDYIMVDGLRITMTPTTAQKVADHFNMQLPTDKMSQQIYQAADTKLRAAPLSGSGYQGSDGKFYQGKDVVKSRINQSDAAIEYNKLTDEEIKKRQQQLGKNPTLIAGHGKDILQPLTNSNDPTIGGWHGESGIPLQPYSSPHKGQAQAHTEYGLYTRLVDDKVTLTGPDGKIIETTMAKLLNNPETAVILATKPGVQKYSI